jgi:hypothetical protein
MAMCFSMAFTLFAECSTDDLLGDALLIRPPEHGKISHKATIDLMPLRSAGFDPRTVSYMEGTLVP